MPTEGQASSYGNSSMIDKVVENRLATGCTMPAGEKHHVLSNKKVALRELLNESRNITNNPPANPIPKETLKALTPDSGKVVGTKRNQPDGSPSPSSCQPQGKYSPLANLVYVRRKLETEQSKMGGCANVNHVESPESRDFSNCMEKPNMQKELLQEPKATSLESNGAASSLGLSFPHSHANSISGSAGADLVDSVAAVSSFPADPHKVINEDWKARFLRLQMFLKTCDQSNQDGYIQMLRSLSAIGRSRHAVELEKRAIHLLLEEGKELQRMKFLNILGKSSVNDHEIIPS